MRPVWRIEMLGTLRAVRDGEVVTRFRTRRIASLLAYLSLHRHQVLSRDTLADLLWPEIDFEVARRNLRQALYGLRQALEFHEELSGKVLLSINDGVQLNPEAAVTDVEEFERLLREEGKTQELTLLQGAVELYKGPLLSGLPDAWITDEQLRLEELYVQARGALGERTTDSRTAIGHLQAALKLDPTRERWHVGLMAHYLNLGEPYRAKEQYRVLEQMLRDEFDKVPAPATLHLMHRIEKALAPEGNPPNYPYLSRDEEAPPKVRLPTIGNRTFGREVATATVCGFLEEGRCRMVTVLGPAGVGKTRLAITCGKEIAGQMEWDVVFVPLADRLSAGEIYEAIATALEATSSAAGSEVSAIIRQTEDRPTLIILDNLEQIASDAGPYISKLLGAGPNLRCLATSRQSLQIQEEQLFHLETLPLPRATDLGARDLESIPSVQLFLDRCRALRPDLVLNEDNAEAIAELCLRFDGLPLAIEIAAGLSNTFSPNQMAHHLPWNPTELVNRRLDAPERHRTLKAAIEWGFISTPAELHHLFLNLCVFRGGFTLRAASEICSEHEAGIVPAVNSLVERSLIRRNGDQEWREPRFELLTAFREYAEQEILPSKLEALRETHAEFFVTQTPPERYRSVKEQTEIHLEIEADYENFLAAIEFSLSTGKLERGVALLHILSARWLTRGPRVAERELIRRVHNHPFAEQMSSSSRVRLLRMMGTTQIRSAEYDAAYQSCQTAVQIAEKSGDRELLATSYSGLSVCAGYMGRLHECLNLCHMVLELVGEENLVLAERSHLGIGSVLWDQGKLEEASHEFALARRLSEKLRGGEPDALILLNQADIQLGLSHVEEASRIAHEAIRICKRLKDEFTLAMALTVIARCQVRKGELPSAAATNLEALDKFRKGDFEFWTLKCLRNHALILTRLGDLRTATTLFSATAEVSSGQKESQASAEAAAIEEIKNSLSPETFEGAWAKGLGMNAEDAFLFISEVAIT